MIKIKNNILIYFIFYINNISFLRNEENEQIQDNNNKENEKTLTDTQIQDYNNKERNSEQKNENIISENIFKDKKKILLLIPLGIVLLFILLFAFYKIKNKETTEEEIKEKELNKKIIKILEEKQIELYIYIENLKKEIKIFKILKKHYSFVVDDLKKVNKKSFLISTEFDKEDFYKLLVNSEKNKKILFCEQIIDSKPFSIHEYNIDDKNKTNKDYSSLELNNFILYIFPNIFSKNIKNIFEQEKK